MNSHSPRRPTRSASINLRRKNSKVPVGLRLLFVCICKQWFLDGDQSGRYRTVENFVEEFLPVFNHEMKRYNLSEYTFTGLTTRVTKLNNGLIQPSFSDISAYARFINVPPGILLLISQVIGGEIQKSKNQVAMSAKDFMQRFMNAVVPLIALTQVPNLQLTLRDDSDPDILSLNYKLVSETVYSIFDRQKQ